MKSSIILMPLPPPGPPTPPLILYMNLYDSLVVSDDNSTISPKLVEMVVDDDTSAHGVWKRLKDLFHNNKDARVTQLDNEIRNMAIVMEDEQVSRCARVIRLREKALTFDELRSMMLLEESDMSYKSVSSTLLHNTPSSPIVLVASTTPTDKANTMNTSGFDVLTPQGQTQPTSVTRASQQVSNVTPKPIVPNTNSNTRQPCMAQNPQPVYSVQPQIYRVYFHIGHEFFPMQPSQPMSIAFPSVEQFSVITNQEYDVSKINAMPSSYIPPATTLPHERSNINTRIMGLRCPMVTRAKAGISKPLAHRNCHVTTTSPIPRSHLHALRDPHWHKAMIDEYNALISNGTWALVPRPANVNVVRSMWLFRHKYNVDGSLSRYKARLVANGHSQQQGIDCDETFSSVVKPTTIHTVLSLVVTRDWPIHQLDVKNAFLHGQLSETVYMHQPPGFVDSTHPDYVCSVRCMDLNKLLGHGFSDAIVLTASSTVLLQRIITLLHGEFAMTDLGSLNYFLGISAQRSKSGLFLSQSKFAAKILERTHMQHCNPCKTLVDTESKLGSDGDPISNPTLYRSLAGALQYLTFTRPDISYAVQQICLYMHDPCDPHFNALKRILRYVRGTLDHGLQLHVSSASQLTAFTDADWAGCPVTRRSTSGYCVFFGDNLLSWSAKRQVTLSRSSAEAEYRGVANVVAKTAWIQNLLLELHAPLTTATLVYCDNVRVLHVPSRFQYADIFTKGLPTALFLEFRSSLNVRRPPVPTAGEY
ncbi:ribonuclease H-like domain-containing protein [Tanacetum coccineum]